ncbi:MAG: RNA polymerase factor sigma-54 [Clostridium chrysemydis]|uniref:RNA polymerase factor sigma-54 n=1 Tax=Clostridium TaxID=1485 RepID=UPI0021538BE2|nr:RNA polymerase factor sigma-54 [Clostridium sp. LY3-2]MCR6513965.1 RNA polymerase factor sigma-54 [Clostridium sp. LY3-2]
MKMDYSISLTQEQKLVMTQEMQMSIKLLQMSVTELREYIDKEYAENPVLNLKEDYSEKSSISEDNGMDKYDYKEMIKYFEFDNYGAQSYSSYDNEDVSPFNFISEKKSLKEFLHEELMEMEVDNLTKEIGDYIIENLDHRGYLECKTKDIAEELNIGEEKVLEALEVVQDLEPYGIGARDIKECLLIQLDKLALDDEIMVEIVNNHLEDIANNKYGDIAKKFSISPREAQRYGDVVKKLEPKPSRGFYTGEEVKFIIPDAAIREFNDEYVIIMNDSVIPKLSISNTYKTIINNDENKETTDYVKEKLNKALFLIKSIEQRRSTLYRVLEKIIEKQKEYFKRGENFLKPMTLKEIAEELELHESTISRAIKDKYILIDRGTVKIKDLFTTAIGNDEDLGVLKIKNRIKEIIDGENKSKPYSDQNISDMLKEENIKISRRTVAKYREEINIPSSSKRKRL